MRLPLWSLVLGVLAHSVLHAANAPPEIRNLKAQQRPGTYLVDITFDLVDPDSVNGVFLSAEASVDNGANYNLPAKTVTGDVGLVKPGAGKKIVWDALRDWPDKYTESAKVRVIASDSLPQGPRLGPDGFVWIPPGNFVMGSPVSEGGEDRERPQHEVIIFPGFWMCDHEVTQKEYETIMGSSPALFKGESRPVENIKWSEAAEFCKRLTNRERLSGKISNSESYRLPTEAEWEYAARAGTTTARYNEVSKTAWIDSNSGGETKSVKLKQANPWGLYDMLGNVWEWVWDLAELYPANSVVNPVGAECCSNHLFRGGAWSQPAGRARAAQRYEMWGDGSSSDLGFRIVLSTTVL